MTDNKDNKDPEKQALEEDGAAPDDQTAEEPAATAEPEEPAEDHDSPETDQEETTVYKPEGLPDHMLGTSDQETLDKLLKAYKGARDELANKKGLPEKYEDYTIDLSEEDSEKYLVKNEEGIDPVFETMKKTAFEEGIPQESFRRFIEKLYEQVTSDADTAADNLKSTVDYQFQALGGPEKAKSVVDANTAWIDGLKNRGILTEDEATEMKMHTTYSEGLSWIDKVRVNSGEKPIPKSLSGQLAGDALDEKALHAMMRDPKYWRDKDPAYIQKVTDGFKDLYGEQAA